MASSRKDPELQLKLILDAQFRQLLRATQRCVAILLATTPQALSVDKVLRDIKNLRSLADYAQLGLSEVTLKGTYLEIIEEDFAEWLKGGFSDEFLRAITIQSLTLPDMPPWNAMNDMPWTAQN